MIDLILLRRAMNGIPGSHDYEIVEADLWLQSVALWTPAAAQQEGHLLPVSTAESCLHRPVEAAAPPLGLGQLQVVLPPSSSLVPEPAVREQRR